MRTEFSYRSQQREGNRRRLIVATVLVAFLFAADLVSGGALRHLVRSAAATLSRSVSTVVGNIAGSGLFTSRASLEAQNQALANELSSLRQRGAAFSALEAENQQLRGLARLAQTSPGVTAPVVSSVISSPYGTFLIGAGTSDGVHTGGLVLTAGGFVVGKISDAGAHVSTVSEIFSPNTSFNALIAGTPTIVTGSGGGNAHAELPRGAHVEVGDTVVSPELGQRQVGVVGAVASSSAQATQDVYMSLPVSLGSLQFVYVVSP